MKEVNIISVSALGPYRYRVSPAACFIFVLLLFLFCYSYNIHAETLEIALPNLAGLYDVDGVTCRQDTFHLSKSPTRVDSVWIQLSGIHQGSMYCCEDGASCGPWSVIIKAIIPDTMTPDTWVAKEYAPWCERILPVPPPCDFEAYSIPFFTYNVATWDFLMALQGAVTLDCKPYEPTNPHCYVLPYAPYVDITAAVLVIEGEFSVAVEESSWGAIKALYSQ